MHDPAAHHSATPTQLESWDAQRQRGIAQQIREAVRRKGEDRAAIADAASEAAAQKKRAEREARRQRQLAEAAGPEMVVQNTAAAPSPSPQPQANAAVYTVSVPTTSEAFAWYEPGAHTYETLDAAREAGVWTYPATEEERARCEVFRDLWEKGYYLGGGGKFGGNWLVYPGACRFFRRNSHSHPRVYMQVIRCVIILILLRPCRPPRLPHYVQWKLLRMVGWARRRKRHIYYVDGTR